MHPRYQQLLVTRYNVAFEAAIDAGIDPFSSNWMQHRDALFRRYCVACVQNQGDRSFDWFVMFHPETPREYFEFLGGAAIVILARTTNEAIEIIQRKHIHSDIVVASRVDNDDAIAPDFMRQVRIAVDRALHREFAGGQDFGVSFRNGIVAHAPSQKWRPRSAASVPFLTLVEHLPAGKGWLSPLGINHNEAADRFPVITVDNKEPMWACVVHERNVSNRVLWEAPLASDRKLRSSPRRFSRFRHWARFSWC